MNHKEAILKILKSERQFTPAQLAGLINGTEKSVYNRVAELREEGYSIYRNTTKNGKVAYRMGTPSREMVALAFSLKGSEIFQR